MDDLNPLTALELAVERAGSQSAIARALSTPDRPIRQGHVWAWLNREKRLPSEFVLAVETQFGVSRHDLREDVFGPHPDREEAAPEPLEPAPADPDTARVEPLETLP